MVVCSAPRPSLTAESVERRGEGEEEEEEEGENQRRGSVGKMRGGEESKERMAEERSGQCSKDSRERPGGGRGRHLAE